MMRRFIFLLSLCCFILASCTAPGDVGGGDSISQGLSGGNNYNTCPAHPTTQAASPESGKVTLTVAGWASSSAEDALVQQQLQNFMKMHPTIKVNWTPVYTDYTTQLSAYITNGGVPDAFYMPPSLSPNYISSGQLLNLSPYMARDKVRAEDYYSALLSLFSCKAGQVYGLPKDWNSLGVFYNKALFKAAHIPFPDANWTWNDLRTIAKKLTKLTSNPKTSVYGISLPASSSRWLAFLFANGGSVLNHDGTQSAFNSQAGVDALNYYAGFQQDHSSQLASRLTDNDLTQIYDAFWQGRTALIIEGGWLIPYLEQKAPSMQYGIAPLPIAPNGQRGDLIFTNAWSAYAGTRHPDAAWELIKYMTGQTVQQSVLNEGFALPTLKSLANDPYFKQHPEIKVLFDAAQYGHPDVYGPQDTYIHTMLTLAINSVLTGHATAQSALDTAAQQINRRLEASP